VRSAKADSTTAAADSASNVSGSQSATMKPADTAPEVRTDTDANRVACPTGLSQSDRRDSNQAK